MNDYKERKYLSSIETAKYLGITVRTLHSLVKESRIESIISAGGQKRFKLKDLKQYEKNRPKIKKKRSQRAGKETLLKLNSSSHKIYIKDAVRMKELKDNSVHLMITSPPYFNAKMYTKKPVQSDLGNIHDLDQWFEKIGMVWKEVFRTLQPGRKAFINIMNLPIREGKGFRTLNLTGRTIDIMEQVGFIFKRDIVWHKTNGVKAHFGTYPYPGGILINNMHEFILEFNKPEKKGFRKYSHLTKQQKEDSKLDKEFWLSVKNTDVWKMKPEGSGDRRSHVAPFPYELPYRIIKAFSYVSETVLDPFLGSGTTAKAAADLQRNSAGYEIAPEIAEEAIADLKNHQNRLSPPHGAMLRFSECLTVS